MGSRIEVADERVRLSIDGSAGVGSVPFLAEALGDALGQGKPVDLDLGELSDADLSFLQLLLSARASAEALNVDLQVSSHGYAFERLLEEVGLSRLLEQAWVGGGEKVQYLFFDDEDVG